MPKGGGVRLHRRALRGVRIRSARHAGSMPGVRKPFPAKASVMKRWLLPSQRLFRALAAAVPGDCRAVDTNLLELGQCWIRHVEQVSAPLSRNDHFRYFVATSEGEIAIGRGRVYSGMPPKLVAALPQSIGQRSWRWRTGPLSSAYTKQPPQNVWNRFGFREEHFFITHGGNIDGNDLYVAPCWAIASVFGGPFLFTRAIRLVSRRRAGAGRWRLPQVWIRPSCHS